MKICCITGSVAFTRSPRAELSTGTLRQPRTVWPSAATTSSTMSRPPAGGFVARHEELADRVVAGLRQIESELGAFGREEIVRDLGQHAATVAERRVRTDRAAMVEIDQDLQALFENVVRLAVLHVGDEADAAGIVLLGGIVKALGAAVRTDPRRAERERPSSGFGSRLAGFWRSFSAPPGRPLILWPTVDPNFAGVSGQKTAATRAAKALRVGFFSIRFRRSKRQRRGLVHPLAVKPTAPFARLVSKTVLSFTMPEISPGHKRARDDFSTGCGLG